MLRRVYTGRIGAEFMHISSSNVRNWVRDRIEARPEMPVPDPAVQRGILSHLLAAEAFERFLHTRYVGQKRFSLEGGETLMPMLETILSRCPALGIQEIVMGMAHRGRLNVLANFLKKPVRTIFTEFSENYTPDLVSGDGDVKYHLGYESQRTLADGKEVGVQLASNPSHLEFGRSRRAGQGPRAAAYFRRHRGAQKSAAPSHPRRRGVHRPGHRGGNAQHEPAPRLPHGRDGAHRRQQPDRVHHAAGGFAFVALLHGRGENDRRAGVPRQRRRPGGRLFRGGTGGGVPAGVQARCHHRHVLLPPLRPQRGRRAEFYPARPLRENRPATRRRHALPRPVGEGRARHARRRRGHPQGIRERLRNGVRGGEKVRRRAETRQQKPVRGVHGRVPAAVFVRAGGHGDFADMPGKDRPRRHARAGIHPRSRQAAAQPARPPVKSVREGRPV